MEEKSNKEQINELIKFAISILEQDFLVFKDIYKYYRSIPFPGDYEVENAKEKMKGHQNAWVVELNDRLYAFERYEDWNNTPVDELLYEQIKEKFYTIE